MPLLFTKLLLFREQYVIIIRVILLCLQRFGVHNRRTDIWYAYIDELTHNPILTLFGEGFSNVIIGKKSSHNTIIQGVFQFGLIGFPFLIAWILITIKNLISQTAQTKLHFLYILLMCVGIVIPWMALDILFFDELFLLPIYGAFCRCLRFGRA